MKKQLIVGMAVAALLTACNQNGVVTPDDQTAVASARSSALDSFGKGTVITQDKLPQTVRDYLTKTYAGYTFGRAEQVTTRDGVVLYAVMIKQGDVSYFLLFDANGAFVSVRKKNKHN